MLSEARYDLHLSPLEFWALTPRNFDLLWVRRRADLAHREMSAAFTTAAVHNNSLLRRADEWKQPLDFMPSDPRFRLKRGAAEASEVSPEQRAELARYEAKAIELANELKSGQDGPWMRRIRAGEAV